MNPPNNRPRIDRARLATAAKSKRGLEAAFPSGVAQQLSSIDGPSKDYDPRIQDLAALLWCSLDNDDSLDLDQLTSSELLGRSVAARSPGGGGRRLYARQEGVGAR